MTDQSQANAPPPAKPADDCPLSPRDQTRNLVLVGVNTALSYLASPVLYVGIVHVPLCKELGASATVYNLPSSAYLVMCVMPLFVGWLFPKASQLKPVMVTCYALLAAMSAVSAVVLMLPVPNWQKVAVIVLQGAVVGGARTVAVALEFEVLGRGVSASRRGTALGLAYGIGPILAIIAALGTQLMLTGKLGPAAISRFAFPGNFALLFAVSVPIMALGSFLSGLYVLPSVAQEAGRQPFLQGVFGGLGSFLSRRIVLLGMLIAIAVLAGYNIMSNMAGYSKQVLEKLPAAESATSARDAPQDADDKLAEEPREYAGYQLTIRFTCKALAGVLFGWLLSRTNPKVVVLISATVGLAGVAWATIASKELFLLSFGLLGAGELFGIYITNYILCCAPQGAVRRYMSFTMVSLLPAAGAGMLFGWIVDRFPPEQAAAGFRASFLVAMGFILLGIGLSFCLPKRPSVEDAAASE